MFRNYRGPCWDRTNDPPDIHRDALTTELRIRDYLLVIKTLKNNLFVDPVGIEPTTLPICIGMLLPLS